MEKDASYVSALRELKEETGKGVVECKAALTAANGDIAKAKLLLNDNIAAVISENSEISLADLTAEQILDLFNQIGKEQDALKLERRREALVDSLTGQVERLNRRVDQITKAYNSLIHSLAERDREIEQLLRSVSNSKSAPRAQVTYQTFMIGDFF
jgi:hypothetical protein